MRKIVLLGCGGHAKSVIDTIEQNNDFQIIGFLDVIEKKHMKYRGYSVIGTDADLEEIRRKGVEFAFITIGFMGKSPVRMKLFERLRKLRYQIPAIIDKSATIATDCQIGEGTFIGKKVVVNSSAIIGSNCIINTGVIIEHDTHIGNGTHVAVGSIICGGCDIKSEVFIGANSVVIQNIEIEEKIVIGAGSKIVHNQKKVLH